MFSVAPAAIDDGLALIVGPDGEGEGLGLGDGLGDGDGLGEGAVTVKSALVAVLVFA